MAVGWRISLRVQLAGNYVVDPLVDARFPSKAAREVGLRIEIYEECPLSGQREVGAEINGACSLAHAALLVDENYGTRHAAPSALRVRTV